MKNLSDEQLRGIGLVAVLWNEIIFSTDCALYSGLGLPRGTWIDIVGQIPETTKGELLQKAASDLRLPSELRSAIDASVRTMGQLKKHRDAVVHSTPFNVTPGLGHVISRGQAFEILGAPEALESLIQHLQALQKEIEIIGTLFDQLRGALAAQSRGAQLADGAQPGGAEFAEILAQLRSQQCARGALPHLVTLPQ